MDALQAEFSEAGTIRADRHDIPLTSWISSKATFMSVLFAGMLTEEI